MKRITRFPDPRILIILIVVVLLLAGCGGNNYKEGPRIGVYQAVVIPWLPGELHCVRMDTGGGNAGDSGLSCDWERWHKETRQ